jgi:CARDB
MARGSPRAYGDRVNRRLRRRAPWASCLALAATALLAPSAIAAPEAGASAKPDLVISKGSVKISKGRVKGSFTVKNKGGARAGRSTAVLKARISGKTRAIKRFRVGALRASKARRFKLSVKKPKRLASTASLRVCADSRGKIGETSEGDNCRTVSPKKSGGGGGGALGSNPTSPVQFTKDTVFKLGSYWITVPQSYDASHKTPITLFVWMHGCGGESSGDISTISPGGAAQSYIAIAVDGREDQCWDPNVDQPKVLGAIADVETHFDINKRHVVIGGYSSGGDLAYRTAFYNSRMFAGLLAENTSPFRDTGSTQAASLKAASFKFHVVHLAHQSDDTYGIAGVRQEVGALKSAGFPAELIERPGSHYDDSTGDFGTDHDLQTVLLPHLTDNWRSP